MKWRIGSTGSQGKRIVRPQAVTQQHDVRNVYIKKRMPRARRRRWVSFKKKVQAVAASQTALQTAYIREQLAVPWNASQVGFCAQSIYSANGSAGTATVGCYNDLAQICTDRSDNLLGFSGSKVTFQSCCMDTTIANTSSFPIVIECYEYITRSEISDTPDAGSGNSVEAAYTTGFAANTNASVAPLPKVGPNTLGSTPFNNSAFTNHFQILRKKRIQIGANEIFTMTMRDPKNHTFYRLSDITSKFNIRGVTRGWLFQFYGSPDGAGTGPANFTLAGSVKIFTQRAYNYYIINTNTTRDYIAQ